MITQREPHFSQFALRELLPFSQSIPVQFISGKNQVPIAYQYFTHRHQRQTSLLILVNGRAENLLKWSELAYDFYHQGYDLLLFDHRGQGYSGRLFADPEKGDIDEFCFYAEDMAKLIQHIEQQKPYSRQYLLAHSLGSLISTYYLANYPHRICKAVLSSPFYGVPLKHHVRDKWLIRCIVKLGFGHQYVFGKGRYKPAHLEQNELSFCHTRMKWMNRVNRKFAHLHLGGPTFRWVYACLQAIERLPLLIPHINLPVLILQAEQEKIVNNQNLPKLTALFPQSQCKIIENAKHEILFEKDKIRTQVLADISHFLAN